MDRAAYAEMGALESVHWWFAGRRKIVQHLISRFRPQAAQLEILEIGCGYGGNLEMLSQFGQLSAMELDDMARETASQRGICPVEGGKLPDPLPFAKQFDLICLLDVLEHVEADEQSLQTIHQQLNTGGRVLITVPAFQFLWSKHDVMNHHFRRYHRSELTAKLEAAGFKMVYSSYFNTLLFPVIVLIRMLNKLLGREGATDVSLPAAPVNKLLTGLFTSERRLLPSIAYPFGVSLVGIAEKVSK